MSKFRKILTLCVAVFMVMQVVMPTLSHAVDTIKLNIQSERPYSDDDGDGVEGNDIYTLVRQATQTLFKIGEQSEEGNLSFDNSYYCLRGGLGFGGTAQISQTGVDYTKLADLTDKDTVMDYFINTIGYEDMPEANYNAIYWIAENMYLPKVSNAEELKEILLKNAGITNSLLTDDDIEVVQQMALWYFTNYDENGLERLKEHQIIRNNKNAGLYLRKPKNRIEELEIEIMKKDIEIARLKKGYSVKGVGQEKEFVTTFSKNIK